jgi:GDP-L-fucose synthase
MKKESKIFVAGHNGLVGSAITRALRDNGFTNILTRSKQELNLTSQQSVLEFFHKEKPEYVFLAAAKVGGIMANKTHPADFIRDNLIIQWNIIEGAHQAKVAKLLFLGSSCIYPKFSEQPIIESSLLTGPLEESNRAYAIAKIAGIEMCQSYAKQFGDNFISAMPTNLYGPEDNFDLENSHVLPAVMRKLHEAKERGDSSMSLWGTGMAKREFLYVDDLASALLFIMEYYSSPEVINVGTGEDVSILELAEEIKLVTGFTGEIIWDSTKPDGTPRKLLDVSKLTNLGWKYSTPLKEGVKKTYDWFVENIDTLKK